MSFEFIESEEQGKKNEEKWTESKGLMKYYEANQYIH